MARELRSVAPTGRTGDEEERRDREEPISRLVDALNVERCALKDLISDYRRVQGQNSELVDQILSLGSGTIPERKDDGHAVKELRREVSNLSRRNDLLKSENTEHLTRAQSLMEENNNLFKLYVASHRLHATLHTRDALQVIAEIILNLIGASIFAIYFHDERSHLLEPVVTRGLKKGLLGKIPLGEGAVGCAAAGDGIFAAEEPPGEGAFSPDDPYVVIPMKFQERVLGAIVIYRLLDHKPQLNDVDHALFEFFADHAATAIHKAKLFTASEKKLSTMKEFLTMMKDPAASTVEGDNP